MMSKQNLRSFRLPEGFRGRGAIVCQLWWIVQALFFSTSPQFMYGYRVFILRIFGAKIGKAVRIRPSVKFTFPWKVVIGDYSWIGDDVVFYSLGEIEVGKNVVISQKSYLCTGTHDYRDNTFPIFAHKITIEDEVWIASDVFINPGIKVERGAVVGARSLVTKNLTAGGVYIGSPAEKVSER